MDVEGFAALGVKAVARAADEDVIEVWDINAGILDLFLTLQGSWRLLTTPRSTVWLGFDYAAVDVVMRRLAIEDEDGEIFRGLQVMERAVIEATGEIR